MENFLLEKYKKAFDEGIERQNKATEILERGIANCYDNPENWLLVVGINPSYKSGNRKGIVEDKTKLPFTIKEVMENNSRTGIWRNFKNLYYNPFGHKVAYLDLFPIRCSRQNNDKESLEVIFKDEIDLKVKLLTITQKEIERLNPKVIVIHNKQSFAYWGGYPEYVWMGYHFKEISRPNKRIEIYEIDGLREGRIMPDLKSNLIGRKVIVYGLYDERCAANSGFNLKDDFEIIQKEISEELSK